MSVKVYLGIGANLEPLRHLERALAALRAHDPHLEVSPAYRSPAVGFDGPEFVNLVAGFDFHGDLPALKHWLTQLESRCGRRREQHGYANRPLDLDILTFGDRVGRHHGIDLPHPDILSAAHVLKPFSELAPDWRHPHGGQKLRVLWRAAAAGAPALVPCTLAATGPPAVTPQLAAGRIT